MQDCIAPQTAVVQYNLLSLPVSETLLAVHARQGEKRNAAAKTSTCLLCSWMLCNIFFGGRERESCLLAAGKRLNFDSILVKPGKL